MQRGAEAIIRKRGDLIIKERIKKGYRIKEIDEKLRRERTKREFKLLVEAKRAGVPVPQAIKKDLEKMIIEMEYIEGKMLKEILDNLKEKFEIMEKVGESIGKLHKNDIIHGDLTTSNMIKKDGKIYFIDFGLGFFSKRIEDKAVDLHLLHQALEARHLDAEKLFEHVKKGYKREFEKAEVVFNRLEIIEKRGRYAKRTNA